MQTIIYFLRHGNVYNPERVLYGRLAGFGLSDVGRNEVAAVSEDLNRKGIDFIYSSPLLRARQTAGILAKTSHVGVKTSSLLIETGLLASGLPLETFRREVQPVLYTEEYILKGQESVTMQAQRMLRFVRMIEKRHGGKRIAAVSHGDPIVILRSHIEGVPFTQTYKAEHYVKTGTYITLSCRDGEYTWI